MSWVLGTCREHTGNCAAHNHGGKDLNKQKTPVLLGSRADLGRPFQEEVAERLGLQEERVVSLKEVTVKEQVQVRC